MTISQKQGLRSDGKLKKGYRFKDGQIIKSKAKICKEKVSRKIGTTMAEYKKGNKNIKTPEQAIAVGYKMTIKENPQCKKDLRNKKK